jgi:RNA polymerase sigma-70 factor, ECF subfamily
MDPAATRDFDHAYRTHHRAVYAAALRVLGDASQAQDVTQDVFMRLWRRPERFDAGRGDLGPYLRLMARSRAVDVWRERDAAHRAGDRLKAVSGRESAPDALLPAEAAQHAERRAEVGAALGSLPGTQREAVVLSYWAGLTASEIAERDGVPLGTAKSRIRLGLAKLRDELEPLAA